MNKSSKYQDKMNYYCLVLLVTCKTLKLLIQQESYQPELAQY